MGPQSPVEAVRQRGGGYYHLCFLVDDIEASVARLVRSGFVPQEFFVSEAFGGRRCCFLFNPFGHIVELAEMPAAQLAAVAGSCKRSE